MNTYSKHILDRLKSVRNVEKAAWLENYVKHDIKSLGVGIPEIREIVQSTVKDLLLTHKSILLQIQVLNELMEQIYTESKLASIIYLQLYWKKAESGLILKLISEWFENKWISDWNVCDWLCVRLISPLIDKDAENIIEELTLWNKDQYLWKARASLVPFAESRSISKHTNTILSFSELLIKREERFCKTAVGWVLRQYSKTDNEFVTSFLDKHEKWLTKEVIANATKYLKQA
jgi:3-methyladenine DNA glycosylase AlkD